MSQMDTRLHDLWWANCNVISDDGEGKDPAPPLPMVAREAPDHLRAFLTGPHPPMPNFNLSRQEIDDVVAYLHSLAGR
jgi:cytochrome c